MNFEEDRPEGAPAWVVTFGDMMSLLLCFFVLLFSMSETQSNLRFQAMAEAMREQFGKVEGRRYLFGPHKPLQSVLQRSGSEQFSIKDEEENARSKEKMKGRDRNRVWTTRDGEMATLGVIIAFDEQSSDLSAIVQDQLHRAAEELRGKPNRIEIRGHTTARPLSPDCGFADEWQLAFSRCHKTMQYMVDELGIDRDRIRLSIAGKNEPAYTGTDPNFIQENSRVEVFLLREMVDRNTGG